MEFVVVNKDNLEKEHICCAISNNKDIQVQSKKSWLEERFDDGLVFLKANERGKCFIEYIPAENAWIPIIADDYMYIDCLWVSGALKGHGYSSELLDKCIQDTKSKGKKGLCILSSEKKKPFLADPKFLLHKGFKVCDRSSAGIELWYLPFEDTAELPKFKECAKEPHISLNGYVLFRTNQCPFTAKYAPIIENIANENGVEFRIININNKEDAQNAPTPVTSYALFKDGCFLTNEVLSEKKFLAMIGK